MHSEPRDANGKSDRSSIPDLRKTPLALLAQQAAAGEKDVTAVVSRIVGVRENAGSVSATMFNSTI